MPFSAFVEELGGAWREKSDGVEEETAAINMESVVRPRLADRDSVAVHAQMSHHDTEQGIYTSGESFRSSEDSVSERLRRLT
jgi:hypothetical protein